MYPENYLYSNEHEWFHVEGDECTVGITAFAQDELGEVVFVELPETGTHFDAHEEIGTIESVKAVSEIYTALAGEVSEVNKDLETAPEKVNDDPHGEGWLIRLKLDGEIDREGLMDAQQYQEYTTNG